MKRPIKPEENTPDNRRSRDELCNFFDNANDLIQSVSEEGKIVYANRKWLETLGYKAEDLPLLNITDIIRDDQVPHCFDIMNRVKQGEKFEYVETVFKTKDGRNIFVEGNINATMKNGRFSATQGIFRDITQRKAIEETYRLLVHHFPTPIYIVSQGIFRFVNPAFQAATGYAEPELIGKEYRALIHPEDQLSVQNNITRAMKSPRPLSYEYRLLHKNGEIRWVMETVISIPYEGDRAVLCTLVDLTGNKLSEMAINEAKNHYQTLFNSASDAIYIHDVAGRILEVNEATCKLLGYSKVELLKMKLQDFTAPESLPALPDRIKEILSKGFILAESGVINHRGKLIPIEIHASLIEYQKLPAIMTVSRDIAERKQVEIIRNRHEARLESLLKIAQIDTGHTQDLLNLALDEIIQLTESKLGHIYVYDNQHNNFTLSSWYNADLKKNSSGSEHVGCQIDKSGILVETVKKRKPVILNTTPSPKAPQGRSPDAGCHVNKYLSVPIFHGEEIMAIVCVANRDTDYSPADVQQIILLMDSVWNILERWRVEEALRESEHRFRQLIELSQDGILRLDEKAKIVLTNPAACAMFGYSQDEMVGQDFSKTYLPEERPIMLQRLAQIKLGKPILFERQALRKNGVVFPIEVSISPLTQGHFQEVIRDISERKIAENKLRDSEQFNAALQDGSPNPIVVMNPDSSIAFVNPAFEKLTGFTAGEVVGLKPPFPWWSADDRKQPDKIVKVSAQDRYYRRERQMWNKAGEEFWVELSAVPVLINGQFKYHLSNWTDITERKQMEIKNLQLAAVVESSDDAILRVDTDGIVRSWNRGAGRLYGYSEKEAIGMPMSVFIPPERKDENLDIRRRIKLGENLQDFETVRIGKDGKTIDVSLTVSAIRDAKGIFIGTSTVARDITEHKKYQQELEMANQRLKELDKLKDNFLSTVSHELRTPLTSIKSFAEILLSYDEDKATQKEFLGIINDESDRLTRLINDFLDISKIQAGRMQWQTVELSLTDAIKAAVNNNRLLIEKAKLDLQLNIEPDLPLVLCDKDRLIQVMTNLLGNAIKFTPEGGNIKLKAWFKGDLKENPDKVTVSITDTGIGIAPENHQKIFENFGQVGDVLKDRPKGTGLGLPICKKIIENYHGQIWLESALGKGSTFFFTLPAAKTKGKPSPEQLVTPIERVPGKGKTILVVDDEANIRRFIQHELVARGHRVIESAGGKEAVDLTRKYHPDLITLDIMMPDLNGLDVTAVLKNDPETKNIPILIISIIEDQQKAFRLGANDYITKPFNIEVLLTRVNCLLEGNQKKILVVDDDETLTRSLEIALKKHGFTTSVAHNGKHTFQAVEKHRPNLILLDIMMPEMDGFEVLKALKGKPDTAGIPIILMTGIEIDGGRVKALSLGAVDYFKKGEGFNKLFEAIEKITASDSAG